MGASVAVQQRFHRNVRNLPPVRSGPPSTRSSRSYCEQFENHFVLPYDNTQFVTGIALANPTTNAVVIPANIRNESGQIIDTRQLSLGPYGHTAFTLPDTWPSTSGQRGIIEFLTTGFGVGALGLRFNGAAFTSLSVLENFAWTQ